MEVGTDEAFEALQMSAAKRVIDLAGRYPLPNLVGTMQHLMEHTTPPVRLTRRTLAEVVRRTKHRGAAVENPHELATTAVRVLKERIADQLVHGIRYERINEWYEMTQFDAEIESWQQYLVPAQRSVYDALIVEGSAGDHRESIEGRFVRDLEARDDVKLYLKLPRWFTVPTPVGTYNPDWAIVMEERDEHGEPTGEDLLYLVRETKDENWATELRPTERRKVECGERHFKDALGVNYKVVTTANELPITCLCRRARD